MKLLITLLTFFATAVFVFAGAKRDFKKANELYEQRSYIESLDLYKRLVEEGYKSSGLYYNTGNAYYKTGDWLNALLFYEKAALRNPGNEDIQHNIQFMNKFVVDEFEKHPNFGKLSWISWIMSSNTAAYLSLFFLISGCVCVYLFFVKGIRKVIWVGTASVFFFVLFTSFSFHLKKSAQSHHYGLIMVSSTEIKSEPGSGENLFLVHEGCKVKALDNSKGWVKVKLPDGNVGWIAEETLQLI